MKRPFPLLWVGVPLLSGCSGIQSSLAPASPEADWIANLFWWMTGGAFIIWAIVAGLIVYAQYVNPAGHSRKTGLLIIGGGVIFPTVVLGALLAYGLSGLPKLLARAPEGSLLIRVSGEQWWWRIEYVTSGGTFITANEIRLPVNEPVQFELSSPDVIHSFWIPSLGGKIDLTPGRITHIALHPSRTGRFRGVCAEYCGEAHALMAMDVLVLEKAAFDQWVQKQTRNAISPVSNAAFESNGCGACHTVRGTPAQGIVGPDLTHFGSRLSLGAATLPNTRENLTLWLTGTDNVKPGVHMPHFNMLPDREIDELVLYLESLK